MKHPDYQKPSFCVDQRSPKQVWPDIINNKWVVWPSIFMPNILIFMPNILILIQYTILLFIFDILSVENEAFFQNQNLNMLFSVLQSNMTAQKSNLSNSFSNYPRLPSFPFVNAEVFRDKIWNRDHQFWKHSGNSGESLFWDHEWMNERQPPLERRSSQHFLATFLLKRVATIIGLLFHTALQKCNVLWACRSAIFVKCFPQNKDVGFPSW